ncbi:MAG: hypothetical protein ACO2XZ_01050 [Rickettsiales bacterium]
MDRKSKGFLTENQDTLAEDDKNSIELKKPDVDNTDIKITANESEISEAQLAESEHAELDNISLDAEAELSDSLLAKILKKLGLKAKKKKKKGLLYYNNDLAPTLGNDGLGISSLSEQDLRKKKILFSGLGDRLLQLLRKDIKLRSEIKELSQNIKDEISISDQVQEQNYDNIIDQTEHRAEHIKQLAHVINDLGMNEAAGRWAEGLSDSDNLEKSQKKVGLAKDAASENNIAEQSDHKWQDNISKGGDNHSRGI